MSASRFSVLAIDDDEDTKPVEKKSSTSTSATSANQKKQGSKKAAKKQKAEQERAELVKLAFAFPKTSKSKPVALKSEDLSKNADEGSSIERMISVDSTYEQELAEALKLSRLEYEENKELYEQQKKEAPSEPVKTKKKPKKKAAPVVTMDQFNRPQVVASTSPEVNGVHSQSTSKEAQVLVDEGPRVAQLREELNQRDELLSQLRLDNEKLREEILSVKTRNKKLYGILGQGEMREKAELLVELEKLTKIKDELTAEVENLAAQLQQERSKVSLLVEGKKAAANKK